MRKVVKVHPEYLDLEPRGSIKTADLVYNDIDSVLIRILIDAGYLSQTGWEGVTPVYFVEVKTTAGTCETPLYMSKGQYRQVSSLAPFIFCVICTEISQNSDAINET